MYPPSFIVTFDHLWSHEIQNPQASIQDDVTWRLGVTVQPREPRAWPETSSSTSKTMNSSCISGREPRQSLHQGQKGVGPKNLASERCQEICFLSSSLLGPLLALDNELVEFKMQRMSRTFGKPILPSCTPFENLAVILDGMATEWKGFFQYSVAATCSEQQHVRNNYGPWQAFKRETLFDLPHSLLNACFCNFMEGTKGILCIHMYPVSKYHNWNSPGLQNHSVQPIPPSNA